MSSIPLTVLMHSSPGQISPPFSSARKIVSIRFLVLFAIAIVFLVAKTAMAFQMDEVPLAPPPPRQILGKVQSGNIPLPGVSISATNSATGKEIVTSTDVDGTFAIIVPDDGRYKVSAQLTAFAPVTQEVAIDPSHSAVRSDFQLILLSRAPRTEPPGNRGPRGPQDFQAFRRQFPGGQRPGGPFPGPAGGGAAGRNANGGGNAPGFTNLPVMETGTFGDITNPQAGGAPETEGQNAGSPAEGASIPEDVGAETVAVAGNTPQMAQLPNLEEFRQRLAEAGGPGGPGGGPGGPGGGFGGGGPFGGPGGPGGGGPAILFGGFGGGRNRFNRIRGNISYTLGDSAFDAKPYALNGLDQPKPSYIQNRFSVSLGGPLSIPKLLKPSTSNFFFLSYDGNRSQNPFDSYSTVPTMEERLGNFSNTILETGLNKGTPAQIFDPTTHLQFRNNTIPQNLINPSSKYLLNYIPLPNLPGDAQNFHFVTAVDSNLDDLNFRLIHNFSSAPNSNAGRGGGGRGGFGGGRGGRVGRNLNFGIHYHQASSQTANANPFVSGAMSMRSFDIPVGYIQNIGRAINMFRVDFNRNRTSTQNLYAFSQDITGLAGINGVSQNPFDWGLPSLSFSQFSSVRDITPQQRRDQTFSLGDSLTWNRGKHTWRFGADFRRIQQNVQTDANARGSFVFTGLNTANMVGGVPVTGTGLDFADFLLGLPQQTSAQYGANAYYFRGNSWDLFAQDEWRLRGNLTLNLGVRYEYVSPMSEKYNRIVNLDAAGSFSSVAPVQPNQPGAYNGTFPSTLVNPDRNNFAPRVGIAWKPFRNTVVRTGYGINYNTTAYAGIIQNLAFQPPFAFTQTNVESSALPITLQNGFPAAAATVTNNFGVDRNYRLGYVQIWNFNIQQQLPHGLVLNVDYTGTKGTHLDLLRAPNRGPSGLLIAGVQPFLWESSEGNSMANALSVRLRRRFQHGLSVGGTYVYSKSIDNASTIGGAGGNGVVAQNDLDLAAERGLSSFDQRHKLTADYIWEFPFGTDKRWLKKGAAAQVFGGWQLNGTITLATGIPFTARVLGSFSDVSRGTNGTLRADATGLPVSLSDPTAALFFDTAAFVAPPNGQFGNAARNTISGPPTIAFNMALNKTIRLGESRALELRAQLNNVFNTPQFTAIDTTVNSPTYGEVTNVGSMRRIQFVARFRF